MPPKPFFTFGNTSSLTKRSHNQIDDADATSPRTRESSEENKKQEESHIMQQKLIYQF